MFRIGDKVEVKDNIVCDDYGDHPPCIGAIGIVTKIIPGDFKPIGLNFTKPRDLTCITPYPLHYCVFRPTELKSIKQALVNISEKEAEKRSS